MLTSPHVHQGLSTQNLMYKVNLALLPVVLLGIIQFGAPALMLMFASVVTALLCEALCLRMHPLALGHVFDGSALLTALLFTLSLPPHAPLWLGALGSAIAILLGKHIYGGLGQNLFNPAMLARVVVLISFPVQMTHWVVPSEFWHGAVYSLHTDGATGATLLGAFRERLQVDFSWQNALLGTHNGSFGETSTLLLALGGLWLLQQRVFSWHAPVAMLAGCLFPGLVQWLIAPETILPPMAQLTTGGLMLGAVFIITDPVTGPGSPRGRLYYGALAGLLVWAIRSFGNYPEGVAFAVLLVNAVTPLIDNWTRPRAYGYQTQKEK
ncbi:MULTISPECIES: RnfABCDGE type electron transport complex subunit D [Brenneria]|uniref:Ion-translocating oxidoreductase complex subunit D n=1 Tax=Brenneria nigrifluens DSM 30175 = ATCC 13028 TaxID=1121120 RepID=A0A2U1UPI2_9GAMM|nr:MULTISPECIES: RnfABCDGE type electron transport complex subunit D [Brenneria]EHD21401.1 electron transport complex, RnfABCDGE type, D subunit [Brenneria sp. EniD312]PWC23547.1 RnfABCDGE type electron transport complex subunit D [Brenneria nigrifluens DSM 30175 = ATCC 13028]QCR04528.1 RnfABCDGE type electron transport complex subunit D [Brenneria nigrifluens DSM 30175 = ATCC 13028]